MASRVNTKFVVILVAVIVGLTSVGGILLYGALRTSAEEDLQRGLALMKNRDMVGAKTYIGKAVNKRKGDMGILNHYIEVLEQMPSKDLPEARKNCDELSSALTMAVVRQPGQSEPLQRLCAFYISFGRGSIDSSSWDRIYETTNTVLKSYPDDLTARKYRGMALVNRMRVLDVRSDDRKTAQDDLQTVLAKTPDDLDAQYHLALWNILTARAVKTLEPDKAAQMEKVTRDLADTILAGHPDDVQRLLDVTRLYKELRDEPQVTATLNHLETVTLAAPPAAPTVMADVVSVMLMGDTSMVDRGPDQLPVSRGVQRCRTLLNAALQGQPNSLVLNYALGQMLQAEMDNDGAIAAYRKVQDLKVSNSPVDAYLGFVAQRMSCYAHADLLLGKLLDRSPDAEQKASMLEEATKLIDYLKSTSPEGPIVNSLRGKLALVNEQWAQASQLLDQAAAQFGKAVNSEVMMLSARACEGQNDLGAAIARLEIASQNSPQFLPAHYELVRLYMRVHQPQKAIEHVNAIIKINPRDRIGLQLMANMYVQEMKYQDALDLYVRLDPDNHPDLTIPMAGVYIAWGKKDEAQKILDKGFAQDPKNLQILKMLLDLSRDDKPKCLQYLDKADAVAIEKAKPALAALRMLVEGKDPIDIQKRAVTGDPVKQALRRYAIDMNYGKLDDAAKELAEARRIAPDHFDVIDLTFDDALRRRDYADAKQLADRAAKLNVDAVQGNIYFGRLAMAQERYDEAVAAFQRAAALRPTHSDTFVLLGDAQRRANLMTQAIDAYKKAVELNPANLVAMIHLGDALDARDQYFEALTTLRSAVIMAPQNQLLIEQYLAYEERNGDVRVALRFRQDRAKRDPEDTQNLRGTALLLGRMKSYTEAAEVINSVIAKEGKTPANLTTLATLRYEEKGKDAAIQVMEERVRELGAKATVDDFTVYGRFLFNLGEVEHGIEVFRKAIALQDSKDMMVSKELGDLLFDRRQFNRAAEFYGQIWQAKGVDGGVGPRYAETLIRSGKDQDGKNRLGEAKAVLQAVKDKSGQTPATVTLQGLIAWVQNDLAQADELLHQAVKMAPERAVLHYQLGEFLAPQSTRQSEAVAEFQRAVALDPRLITARIALVQLALHRHDGDEALQQLLEALHWNPQFLPARQMLGELYLARDDRDKLRVLIDESSHLFPQDPTWLKFQARMAIRDGKYDAAIAKLREAMGMGPANPNTATELALAYLANKQPDEAMKLLGTPSTPLMYAARARALFALQQSDPAKSALQKALEMTADYGSTSDVVEQVVAVLGPAAAIELLPTVPIPDQKVLWMQLLVAELENNQSRFDAALARLQRLTTAQGADRILCERMMAVALAKTGKFAEARQAYLRILKTDPNHVATLNNLGYLLIDQFNELDEGLRYAQRANDLAPNISELVDTMGWGQFLKGLNKDAEATLRRSVELRPTASNCYHLARVIVASGGSTADARQKLEQAKTLGEQTHDLEFKNAAETLLAKLAQPTR